MMGIPKDIRLVGAILMQQTIDHENDRYYKNAVCSQWVESTHRPKLESGDIDAVTVPLPPMVALLTIGGGAPGTHILTYAVGYPWDEPDLLMTENYILTRDDRTWATDFHLHIPNLSVKFKGDAVYTLKFLVDGEPLGELPIMLHWDDSFPRVR